MVAFRESELDRMYRENAVLRAELATSKDVAAMVAFSGAHWAAACTRAERRARLWRLRAVVFAAALAVMLALTLLKLV